MTIPKYRTINVEILAKAELAVVGDVLCYDGTSVEWTARPESPAYLVTKTEKGFALCTLEKDLGEVNLGQSFPPCVRCNDRSPAFINSLVDVLEPEEVGAYLGLISPLGREIGWTKNL